MLSKLRANIVSNGEITFIGYISILGERCDYKSSLSTKINIKFYKRLRQFDKQIAHQALSRIGFWNIKCLDKLFN